MPQHELLACAQCGCFAFSCFEDFAIRVKYHPIQRGIENLFSRETLKRAMTHKSAFIDIVEEHEYTERGQRKTVPEQWTINKDDKSDLCNWLCKKGTLEDFQHFQTILDELRKIPGLFSPAATDRI